VFASSLSLGTSETALVKGSALFETAHGRPPTTDAELYEWLRSAEGISALWNVVRE
jgi:hypothetical protein